MNDRFVVEKLVKNLTKIRPLKKMPRITFTTVQIIMMMMMVLDNLLIFFIFWRRRNLLVFGDGKSVLSGVEHVQHLLREIGGIILLKRKRIKVL